MFRFTPAFLTAVAAVALVACDANDPTSPAEPSDVTAAPSTAIDRDQAGAAADSAAAVGSPSLSLIRVPRSFFVNPISGNDTNAGTKLKPFKTLARGLSTAISGDTMRLASGVYSALSGEKFTNASRQVVVPAGVTILGTFAEDFTSQLHGVEGETGLKLLGGATIRNLILSGFTTGIRATQGVQKFKGLFLDHNLTHLELNGTAQATFLGGGVFLTSGGNFTAVTGAHLTEQARLIVDGGTVTPGGQNCNTPVTGVELHNSSRLTLRNRATLKHIAGNAVRLREASKVTLTSLASIDRDFSQLAADCAPLPSITGQDAAAVTLNNATISDKDGNGDGDIGIELNSMGALTLTGATITGHHRAGVRVSGQQKVVVSGSTFFQNVVGIDASRAQTLNMTVTGSTLTGNLIGIGAPLFKLRSSKLTGNAVGVVVVGSQADLGKAADPGNNMFTGNFQSGVQFESGPLGEVAAGTIYAAGNTWNASIQGADASGHYPAGLLVNGTNSGATGLNFRLLENVNFTIQF
jgi:hypothetical protein